MPLLKLLTLDHRKSSRPRPPLVFADDLRISFFLYLTFAKIKMLTTLLTQIKGLECLYIAGGYAISKITKSQNRLARAIIMHKETLLISWLTGNLILELSSTLHIGILILLNQKQVRTGQPRFITGRKPVTLLLS